MIKVSSESQFVVISGRREKVKSDSAVRNELGWGAHTMELVSMLPKVKMVSNCYGPKVQLF